MSVKDSLGYYNSPLPVGTVTAFAGVRPPIKWLLCDGSLITSSQYPLLSNVVGFTYTTTSSGIIGDANAGDVNFTANVTSGTLTAGQHILINSNPPIQIEVDTFDMNTGDGTFVTPCTANISQLGITFETDPAFFNLPNLVNRYIQGGSTTSPTPTPAQVTASFTVDKDNMPTIYPSVESYTATAATTGNSVRYNVATTTLATDGFEDATIGRNQGSLSPLFEGFSPPIPDVTLSYTNPNQSAFSAPITLTGGGAVTVQSLEMTYIIKAEY
jgi:hypothetical protein